MSVHNRFIRDANQNLSPTGLINIGAYFPIEVQVPPEIATKLTDDGEAVPDAKAGMGLIDTGATLTCVHEPIL